MNAREKAIASNLVSDDLEISYYQSQYVFFEENIRDEVIMSIRRKIRSLIRKCFSGEEYAGKYQDIYLEVVDIVVSNLRISRKSFLETDSSLEAYIVTVAKNICIKPSRKAEINTRIGVKNDKSIEFDPPEPNTGADEEDAKRILYSFIKLIEDSIDRDILIETQIKGTRNIDYARTHNMTVNAVNSRMKRVRIEFIQVALPLLRETNKEIFIKNKEYLSKADSDILTRYFSGERNLDLKVVAGAMKRLIAKHNQRIAIKAKERRARQRALLEEKED